MPSDMLNGYICAVTCSPKVIHPTKWLSAVFFKDNDKMPEFSSTKEFETIVTGLADIFNNTISIMGSEDFGILIATGEAKIQRASLERWCDGFTRGIAHQSEEWIENMKDEHYDTLLKIIHIADHTVYKEDYKLPIPSFIRTRKQISEFNIELIYFVQDLFFVRLEQLQEEGREPLHQNAQKSSKPKWGRNQPCPCGSGKKYKKCCGAHSHEEG